MTQPEDGVTAVLEAETADDLGLPSWSVLDRLARSLRVREARLQPTLDAIADAAVVSVSAAKYSGVNLLDGGRFVPQAVAGEPPIVLDVLQQKTGLGPCIDSSRDQVTIRADDLRTDSRWPEYGELALSLGIASMLCVPLWVDDQRLGSVSLYGTDAGGFGEADEFVARLLATQAALALADATRIAQLRDALGRRDVIGQAKGILMERHRCTADVAFAMLSGHSQQTNRRLAEVARALAETGELGR
jgi:GAF domain-containing protein